MLDSRRISYILHKGEEEENLEEDEDEYQTSQSDSHLSYSKNAANSELHYGETWFHGRLKV